MKDFMRNEELAWLNDIERSLHQFPIYITNRHWLDGTNYHYQPGVEIHLTHEGEGTMVIGRQVLLQRVAEGRRLLSEALDVSIADIAYMLGFPTPSHFSRQFKKLTEQTPSEYRKKISGERMRIEEEERHGIYSRIAGAHRFQADHYGRR